MAITKRSQGNPGNFANDPQKARIAGKKGAAAQPMAAKIEGGRNSHRGGKRGN